MKKLIYLALTVLIVSCSDDDNTAPVVTLIGESSITVTQNSTYVDAGATATDNQDGDLTSNITTTSNVDTSTLGTYTVTHSVSDASGNVGSASRQVGVSNSCDDPSTLSFDMALWHEGYSTHLSMTPTKLGTYLDALLNFVLRNDNHFTTVFITVPTHIPGTNEELQAKLTSFVNSLVENQIGIGISFGLDNGAASDPDPPGTEWFDYSQVSSVIGTTHPYILGLDAENYNLNGEKINAVNTMDFVNYIKQKITAAGGRMPDSIAVANTAGYNVANNWSYPLINVFEYYSTYNNDTIPPIPLNGIYSNNVNDPTTAFNQCLAFPIKNPTAEGGGIQGGTVKGWPAFSFELKNGSNCLASSFGILANGNTCGSAEILGNWDYNCILQFMTLFKEHYYPSPSDKPTFVLYQSDFLPCDWIPNGCPEN